MPAPDACLQPQYIEGLEALHAHGLHWEWCCKPEALPSIATACAKFPDMAFVLNHLGHNSGGDDFETWAPAITELAKNTNVVAKLGAIEQWEVSDPAPYVHSCSVHVPTLVTYHQPPPTCLLDLSPVLSLDDGAPQNQESEMA